MMPSSQAVCAFGPWSIAGASQRRSGGCPSSRIHSLMEIKGPDGTIKVQQEHWAVKQRNLVTLLHVTCTLQLQRQVESVAVGPLLLLCRCTAGRKTS